jgi:uncharacterized membrane protein
MGLAALVGGPFSAAPAFAQPAPVQVAQSTTAISGTVTDDAGKAIRNAHITITGPSSASTQSGADGSFSANVPPGLYSVTITASGFQNAASSVTVAAGPAKLSVTLLSASLTTIGRVGSGTVAVNGTTAASNTLTATAFSDQGQNRSGRRPGSTQ